MQTDLQQLQMQVDAIQKKIDNLYRSSSLERPVENSIRERFFANLNGIIISNTSGILTAITPLIGTKVYYVSDTSGGAVTRKLTFKNGVLISET